MFFKGFHEYNNLFKVRVAIITMAGKSIETMTAHERAHIDFPRAITPTEARDLLRGLGDHLSMTINVTY